MGIFDKLKDMMSVPDDDYYEDEEEMEQKEPQKFDDLYSSRPAEQPAQTEKKSRITAMPGSAGQRQMQVVLVKPDRFEDASSVADHLNAKQTVVLNLEATKRETARRLIDFLSGVAYANKAEIKRVATNTFIITPYNVDIQGETMIDEFDESSVSYL